MKILHTYFLHGWGGRSNRILNVCRGLAEGGHDVAIAAPGDSELVRRANDSVLQQTKSAASPMPQTVEAMQKRLICPPTVRTIHHKRFTRVSAARHYWRGKRGRCAKSG